MRNENPKNQHNFDERINFIQKLLRVNNAKLFSNKDFLLILNEVKTFNESCYNYSHFLSYNNGIL